MALNWKGGWTSNLGVSDMTYYKDDVVDHNNVMYIVTANSVPIGSPAPSLDMSKWDTVVSGAIGTSGSSGTSGTSGSSPIGTAKVYTSGTAGTSWTFTHNLGTLNPIVQVWGTNGKVVIPQEIVSVDTNTIKIEFPELVAGKATIGNGYSGTSGTSGTRGTSGTSGFGVPTGGTSGQVLVKNSGTSGDVSWAILNTDGWSTGEATTITAITTNPTKPTVKISDYTRYKVTGRNAASVQFKLAYTSNTGFNNGSGQYLFKLPTGISFDTSIHPLYTGDTSSILVNNATISTLAYALPTFGIISNDAADTATSVTIVPYSATTYRVIYGWGTAETTITSSAFNPIGNTRTYSWQFDITTA
jgi:hypothetical protein